MQNSHRFFRNDACQYFPCHKVEDDSEFNCLFCYCPLYLMDDCKGNPTWIHGIKDCSKCMVPHVPKGYDHINTMLRTEIFEKAADRELERLEKLEKENK